MDGHDLRLHSLPSNAHDVLGIAKGKVTLRIGGDRGAPVRLKAGDVIVLPAGVAHRRLSETHVKVVGAYPRRQSHYDMKREGRKVPRVALPAIDPLFGPEGLLVKAWQTRRGPSPHQSRSLSVRNVTE